MADATEAIVFVPRASVNVDANAGKRTRERFAGNTDAIWKCCNLVELGRILECGISVSRESSNTSISAAYPIP
jgi:hypothetical protein